MRKLWNVLVLMLAVNFVAVLVAVVWLQRSGRLDREKVQAIRTILFPPPATQPAVQLAESQPTTRPMLQLEQLLARHAGKPPAEQLEYLRQSFDSRMAQLERTQRSVLDLQRQVELAQQQLDRDRGALEAQRKKLEAAEQEARQLAEDKGFQDSLALYQSMPSKQAKVMFMAMDDATAVKYLQAMEPRVATRITKEFKTPEELDRLKRIMDRLRQSQVSVKE